MEQHKETEEETKKYTSQMVGVGYFKDLEKANGLYIAL